HAVSFVVAVLDVASTVSAACIVAVGYIVFAGICDAADLSRNLELTESKPSLGEDCWELLKRLSVISAVRDVRVSAGYIIEFMLEDLEAVPADYVPAGHVGYVPAGHVLISTDRYRIC
ncbi:hypothetical protein Tco_0334731, partial [Tanacetum coccineum]